MTVKRKVLVVSVLIGLGAWGADALLDWVFFYEGSFLDLLITNVPPHEVHVRLVSVAALLVFGLILSRQLGRREEAERRAQHLNHVLRAIRNVNQLILRETDPQRLIDGACRELIEARGYYNAWIALVDQEGRFQAAAEAGVGEPFREFVEGIKAGRFPDCWDQAVKRLGVTVVDNPSTTCRECLLAPGYAGRAAAYARLAHRDRVFGLLVMSLPPAIAVDPEEQTLVKELAADVALALHSIEAQEQREQANREVRESRSRLATTLSSIGDAVISVDLEERTEFMNPVAQRLTGWGEEAVGKPLSEVFHIVNARTRKPVQSPVSRVLRQGVIVGLANHTMLISRDGREYQITDSAAPIRGDDGGVTGVVFVFRDITREYHDREALRESEARYRSLFDAMSEGFALNEIICDEGGRPCDYRFLELNPAFERLTGLARDNVVGRTVREVLPQTEEEWIETYGNVALTGEAVRFERYHEELGRHYEVTAYSPRKGFFAAIFADVTERKHTEEELREKSELNQMLLDSLPCVTLLVRPHTHVIVASNAAGKPYGTIPGITCHEAFAGRKDPCPWCLAPELWATGKPQHLEVEVRGSLWDVSWYPISEDLYLHYGFDVTDRRRLEEQFRQAQKMEVVGHLAGGVAHDFRNQLTVINGYCDMLQRGLPKGALREAVDRIAAASDHAANVTRQLLAFSRQQVLQPEPIDLNEAIAGLHRSLSRMIGEDVRIRVNAEAHFGMVKVDRSALEQVVVNLAVNARDAMPRGGDLVLETSETEITAEESPQYADLAPGRYVVLRVRDSGVGMDEETTRRVFEPFFTTKEIGRGTGLGLSMVYGFIKQSNGHIEVVSKPGQGTTFTVYLPSTSETPIARTKELSLSDLPRGDETILVAEDEESVREVIVRVLRECGYRVMEAPNGREALALGEHHEGHIHLLVTDVVMPETGGPELAEQLRAVRPDMKVMFISGYAENAVIPMRREPGTELLTKPFGPGELARAVRRLLDVPDRKRPGNSESRDDDEG